MTYLYHQLQKKEARYVSKLNKLKAGQLRHSIISSPSPKQEDKKENMDYGGFRNQSPPGLQDSATLEYHLCLASITFVFCRAAFDTFVCHSTLSILQRVTRSRLDVTDLNHICVRIVCNLGHICILYFCLSCTWRTQVSIKYISIQVGIAWSYLSLNGSHLNGNSFG